MKKKFVSIGLVVFLCLQIFGYAQILEQSKLWYLSPNSVDFTVSGPPLVQPIPGSGNQAMEVANGMYSKMRPGATPLFYISDGNVFNGNNTSIGFLNGYVPLRTSEFAICPFLDNDNCTKASYYVFYCSPNPVSMANELRYCVIDMVANNGIGNVSTPVNVVSIPQSEWGGIAVAVKQGSGASGFHNLYFVGGTPGFARIYRIKIQASGLTPTLLFQDVPTGTYDFETSELDVSPDEIYLGFASNYGWGQPATTTRYHIVNVSVPTPIINRFSIGTDNSPGLRGVEFYRAGGSNIRVLFGAGADGIFVINPGNPTIGQILISNSFQEGLSQLERASNKLIYAATDVKISAIDVEIGTPSMLPTMDIPTNAPIVTLPPSGAQQFYTLPDQIDFEQYDRLIAEYRAIDLYMKDNWPPANDDIGIQPNQDNGPMWVSPDIWVRKQQDPTHAFAHIHENPEYNSAPGVYNYVYVKVRNESCVDYVPDPTDRLKVYWAKASTALAWPNYWNGSVTQSCFDINNDPTTVTLGDELFPDAEQPLPVIPAGQSAILEFKWRVPNPDDYYCFGSEYKHFCLLARLETIKDPICFEVSNQYTNTRNCNNIVWKNISILNDLPGGPIDEQCNYDKTIGGVLLVGNPFEENDNYDFKFTDRGVPIEKSAYKNAQIKVTLSEALWDKWVQSGANSENIKIKREDCHQLEVIGEPAYLRGLPFNAGQVLPLIISFNYYSDKPDSLVPIEYDLIQLRSENNQTVIGGETYWVETADRPKFCAETGGDKNILSDDSLILHAEDIGEQAYYNWYDEAGTLICSGPDVIVRPIISTKYKLEVIALSDGFVSVDSMTVTASSGILVAVSPNPASSFLNVEYKVKSDANAYLRLFLVSNPTITYNYILNAQDNEYAVNVSGMPQGIYKLQLVCNGQPEGEETLLLEP
jgi:hypothetical protein